MENQGEMMCVFMDNDGMSLLLVFASDKPSKKQILITHSPLKWSLIELK